MWYQATWCKRKQFHSKRHTIRWMEDDSQLSCSLCWLSLVPSLESVPMRMIVPELGPRDWSLLWSGLVDQQKLTNWLVRMSSYPFFFLKSPAFHKIWHVLGLLSILSLVLKVSNNSQLVIDQPDLLSHCSKETTGSAHSQQQIQWISKFDLGVPTRCSILFTDFKTVFIFALRHFVPMVTNFMIKWPRLLFVAIWPLYLAQQIQPSGASLKRVQKCSLAILTR